MHHHVWLNFKEFLKRKTEVRKDAESFNIQNKGIGTGLQRQDHRKPWRGRFTEADRGRAGVGEDVQSPHWEMPAASGAESVGFQSTRWKVWAVKQKA